MTWIVWMFWVQVVLSRLYLNYGILLIQLCAVGWLDGITDICCFLTVRWNGARQRNFLSGSTDMLWSLTKAWSTALEEKLMTSEFQCVCVCVSVSDTWHIELTAAAMFHHFQHVRTLSKCSGFSEVFLSHSRNLYSKKLVWEEASYRECASLWKINCNFTKLFITNQYSNKSLHMYVYIFICL